MGFLWLLFYYNGYKTLLTFLRKYLPEKFQCFEVPSFRDVNLSLIDSNNDRTLLCVIVGGAREGGGGGGGQMANLLEKNLKFI